jgi:Cu-processing system permease protein
MLKILKYTLYDLARSRWTYLYFGFYLIFAGGLLSLSGDVSKVVISMMNVILILCPLVATMFGVMYFYNSREFIELLLAQPVPRTHITLGMYLGIALSLSMSLALGVGLPFVMYGILASTEIWDFFVLIIDGVVLSFIFSGLAFCIALRHENRIKGFGLALLTWLFFAVIYGGLFLLLLMLFREYPLEHMTLGMSILNPIDLSRILLLLKLDISALMGYTGAVFQKFFGTYLGLGIATIALGLWVVTPVYVLRRITRYRDF